MQAVRRLLAAARRRVKQALPDRTARNRCEEQRRVLQLEKEALARQARLAAEEASRWKVECASARAAAVACERAQAAETALWRSRYEESEQTRNEDRRLHAYESARLGPLCNKSVGSLL
eukprot:TRINITY_DN3832_c0_g1_i1.p2 TRINITY_DN3832_c0_g1~~TRINITY_DN3832_c0_g1_i1.p2  ORF type:complete len:119 (-),score=30.94 TRINITY_DN3832_c0_g1_i1:29-385(-)